MNKDLLHSKVELFETGGEISYQGDANVAKFLLGGIGTGNIAVGARGQLLDWEIFNWPGKGQFVPFSFFAIRTKEEGEEPVSRILESKIKPPFYKSHGFLNGELAGIPRFEKSKMVGKQPFVYVDLEDSKVPVKVRMEAYTPFIPLDADNSGIPTAIIKYKVSNPTNKPIDVSVVGTMANVVGFDGYDVFNNVKLVDQVENEYREEAGLKGWYYKAKNLTEKDMKFGSMSIATTNENGISRKKWLHGQWTDNAQDFWDDFVEDGKLTEEEEIEAKGCDLLAHYDFSFLNLKERISSICCSETIKPNEEKEFEFLISWYFPNRPKGWIEYDADLERYRNGGYDIIREDTAEHPGQPDEEKDNGGLNTAKLLIIDDLGAERGTDYALEKVYNIIDSRYLSGKPLILTTNMTLKDMQESEDIRYRRIYDRIFEMCFPEGLQAEVGEKRRRRRGSMP